jgi:hypothetical protein
MRHLAHHKPQRRVDSNQFRCAFARLDATSLDTSSTQCFHLAHASTSLMLPPRSCFHLAHASTSLMLPPRSCFHLAHASTSLMLPPRPCFHLAHASTSLMLPPRSCFHRNSSLLCINLFTSLAGDCGRRCGDCTRDFTLAEVKEMSVGGHTGLAATLCLACCRSVLGTLASVWCLCGDCEAFVWLSYGKFVWQVRMASLYDKFVWQVCVAE